MSVAMPLPDQTVLARRERIVAALRDIVPGEGVIAAEREIPLTLERAPWDFRHALGHFGAYREGVGRLVAKLRSTFDPAPTFAVALEGTGHD